MKKIKFTDDDRLSKNASDEGAVDRLSDRLPFGVRVILAATFLAIFTGWMATVLYGSEEKSGSISDAVATVRPAASEVDVSRLLEESPGVMNETAGEGGVAADSGASKPLINGPELPDDYQFPTREVKQPEKPSSGFLGKVTQAVSGGAAEEEVAVAEPTMGEEEDGFWLRGARLNDVFQYLARLARLQFFHNSDLEAANFVVTGHLGDGDPVSQMEELGMMYGVTIHQKGNTVYALTETQLARLPTKPFQYHLNYLRPSDIEQIRTIIQPILTPGTGTVDYESKTNTLIVIDNEQKIEALQEILAELDQPKQQIAIETRILRIKSSSRNRIGVDWESVLGDGMTIRATEALNSLFNLPDTDSITEIVTRTSDAEGFFGTEGGGTFTLAKPNAKPQFGPVTGTNSFSGANAFTESLERNQIVTRTGSPLVLAPLQLQATIRALNTGGLAQQESSPTLITEDNESGIISIIDRVPIIITTVTETVSGTNISEDVRYRVDLDDPTGDPTTTREIGVTVAVTPTILPDDTIRMKLRPRSAQVVELIEGQSGNLFPRVNESTVDTIARVPNGHSLLIGGFYQEDESDFTKKVPILGDIPILNFAFKSTDKQKEQTSLIFIVTPKLYLPVSIPQTLEMTRGLHDRHVLPKDHKWPDRQNPGFNYESKLGWTAGNVLNAYPDTPPANPLNPDHPDNQIALPTWREESDDLQGGSLYESEQAPSGVSKRRGFFRGLFNKKNR